MYIGPKDSRIMIFSSNMNDFLHAFSFQLYILYGTVESTIRTLVKSIKLNQIFRLYIFKSSTFKFLSLIFHLNNSDRQQTH